MKTYENIIYLDHNATTPLAPEAYEAMLPCMQEMFGNPSSGYSLGKMAKQCIETARQDIAELIGCMNSEIVFTSGGSESNNMILKGIVDFSKPLACHVITSAVEHPAVINPLMFLRTLGVRVTVLPVDRYGVVLLDDLRKAILPETALISVMLANNETGTLEPVREIAGIAKEYGIPVHTDAAQAVGKIHVDVNDLGVDFLTIAGHKLYAPKGIGALYIKNGRKITPLVHGAGQENGLRAGTENVILAAGLGAACRMAKEKLEENRQRMERLRNLFEKKLFEGLEGLVLNGHPEKRLPNTLNISVQGISGARILEGVPGIMASTGAACHDRTIKLSTVLSAMNVPPETGMGAIRFSLGHDNDEIQVEKAAGMIINRVRKMRNE